MADKPKKTAKTQVKVKDLKPKKYPKGGGSLNPQPLPPGHPDPRKAR
jgi:hypothetical protein